jgi:hypothetical protein
MGNKGQPMGTNNPFNGLAKNLNISYAGSNVLPSREEFRHTSPIISFGLGRFSSVPWIVFTNYHQEVMKGIYPVLLFYLEDEKVLLCYGISESNKPEIEWDQRLLKGKSKVSKIIQNPEKYGESIVDKVYDLKSFSESDYLNIVLQDLDELISNFHHQMSNRSKMNENIEDRLMNFLRESEKADISLISESLNISKIDAHQTVRNLYLVGKINYKDVAAIKANSAIDEIKIGSNLYSDQFPFQLIKWGANKPTSVRIPFSSDSGRPAGKVIINKLIEALDNWIASPNGINAILFIGGPGNGKTDALEYIIDGIISKYSLDPKIKVQMTEMVAENRRNIEIDIHHGTLFPFKKIVAIPEASTGTSNFSKEEALLNDFSNYLNDSEVLYISCINRGILEDLKIHSNSRNETQILALIDEINNATKGEGSESWPLSNNPNVGVWFMDIESLFDNNRMPNPSQQIIEVLTNSDKWNWYNTNGYFQNECPFYDNYLQISNYENSKNLSSILRSYELITENKLNFRNYFSLLSSLFAMNNGDGNDPIEFSLKNINLIHTSIPKEYDYIKSVFLLSFASYSLRLFRDWEETLDDFNLILESRKINDSPLLKNFLKLCQDESVRINLNSFQSEYEKKFINQLNSVLDPFHSDHPRIIEIAESFSFSMEDGHASVIAELNINHNRLLEYFRMIENEIRASEDYNKFTNEFDLIIQKLRCFATQICSRIIGTKYGYTKDFNTLSEYNKLYEDFKANKDKLARMFKGIIKSKEIYPLHSFGQPKPDKRNSVIIKSQSTSSKFEIKSVKTNFNRASQNGVFFEHSSTKLLIPLSYNLFKALSEIDSGVDKNSVNSNINALIERMESLLYSQFVHVEPNEYDNLELVFDEASPINLEDLNQI